MLTDRKTTATFVAAVLCLTIGDPAKATTTVVRPDDMLGWWKMGEGATWNGSQWSIPDASGNGNTGPTANMEQADRTPGYPFDPYYEPSYAMRFDGSNEYVETGFDPTLALSSSFTVSAWVNTEVSVGSDRIIAGRFATTLRHNLFFQLTNMRVNFGFKQTSGSPPWPKAWGNTSLMVGRWYHVGGVFDDAADLATVYVNGQPDGTTSFPYLPDASDTQYGVSIGANSPEGNRYFAGMIDDVRIYGAALSADDLAAIYSDGGGDFAIPEPSTLVLLLAGAAGLVAGLLRQGCKRK